MMTVTGSQWQRRAICFLETPDAPELWKADRKPVLAVRVHLERMCQRCPVRRDCAAEAVANEEQAGMYAGVWVPERSSGNRKAWAAAMQRLELIAGTAARPDQDLGVSA
ncbi:WhiB family transcriptional regulator [Mycobacterium sp. SMC-13]|uniref:WhiB family transcriptional regulator n=1 Tax=Mycobacterium sp. SMC-13 TaxID=3381626 RepID=UPI0038776BB5